MALKHKEDVEKTAIAKKRVVRKKKIVRKKPVLATNVQAVSK
jgi:hypothetical protein